MDFVKSNVGPLLVAILVIAAVVGAYQFRRDSRLVGTRWTATASDVSYDINFVTGRRVVLKMSDSGSDEPVVIEGTYTSRGNRVEIHLPKLDLEGNAVIESGKGETLDLTVTSIDTADTVKIKAVRTSAN